MKTRLFLSLIIVTVIASLLHAETVKWQIADGGNGHIYEVVSVPEGIVWTDAKDLAEPTGGYLATITSQEENDFVFNLINNELYWNGNCGPLLGGYQLPDSIEPDGGWQWVTGEPFIYTNWLPGNPDNYDGIEHFLHFLQGPQWNDIGPYGAWNSIPLEGYVVEYIPEPATFLLIGLGGLSVLRRRA